MGWIAGRQALSVVGVSLVFLAMLSSGCTAEVFDEQDLTDSKSDELNVSSKDIWQTLSIPVCWEGAAPSPTIETRRGWVKSSVTSTWQNNSRVKFTGWAVCTPGQSGIHIGTTTGNPTTGVLLGAEMNGVANGMLLNLTFTQGEGLVRCANTFGVEACVRSTAVHEFGHALGFAHEQMRPDFNFDCLDLFGGELGDTRSGAYDVLSIMRSCNVVNVQNTLSATDKLGVQAFYGNPLASSFKKDAIKWDSESLYFFFGSNYTRYSVSQDKMAELFPGSLTAYPATIRSGWTKWPASAPWTSGVDAIMDFSSTEVYMFSGNQYLKMSKPAGAVLSGYPKTLPGGWKNWPAHWTGVDAAIKWPEGQVYLFRGSEYVHLAPGSVTVTAGYPLPIAGNWPGLTITSIDQVVPFTAARTIYFFKGVNYWRYYQGDVGTGANEGVVGSAVPIVGRWKGVTF